MAKAPPDEPGADEAPRKKRPRRRRPHGQGTIYQRGPGNFWIRWREGGRRRSEGGFSSRELAAQVLAKVTNDVKTGKAGLPRDPRTVPTLAVLAKAWHERRKKTHRAADDDAGRWKNHLAPHFGACRPDDVDAAAIRRFVEAKLSEGLNPATVGHCVRLLSTFYSDLVDQKHATANPVRTLPRSTRRLYRPTHDPRAVPFLSSLSEVRRVYQALAGQFAVAFAIGAFAGLRPGEVLGLHWPDVDLERHKMRVRQQVTDGHLGPVKDDEARSVPILPPLRPVLARHKLATGGVGQLFKPERATKGGRPGSPPRFVRLHTLHAHLARALELAKIPPVPAPTEDDPEATRRLTWYEATRHTFASQWVLSGNSAEMLAAILGHSSTVVTARYAHLRHDLFPAEVLARMAIDLHAAPADVLPLRGPLAEPMDIDNPAIGHAVVTEAKSQSARPRNSRAKPKH